MPHGPLTHLSSGAARTVTRAFVGERFVKIPTGERNGSFYMLLREGWIVLYYRLHSTPAASNHRHPHTV